MLIYLPLIAAIATALLLSYRANNYGPSPEQVRTRAEMRATAKAICRPLRAVALPEQKTDRRIIVGAFIGVIAAAAIFGGTTLALLMAAVVTLCVAPTAMFVARTRHEVRGLLKDARINPKTDLYVPDGWHH